jgi:hypothetical protein
MTNLKTDMKAILIIGFILLFANLVEAGFGSTYLPKVNGNNIFEIPIGSNQSYFIYPQNFENQTLLIKINITDKNKLIKNTLQDIYEIPPNTKSDEFEIEIIIGLENKTELINQTFLISYQVLSTLKGNETSSIITFSPIGFEKSFFVVGKEYQPIITPTPTPSIIPTPSQTQQNNNNNHITTSISTPTPTLNPTPIPTPEIINSPIEQEPIQNTAIPSNFLKEIWGFIKNIDIIWIIIITIAIVIGIIISITIAEKKSNKCYKNYDMYDTNTEIK